MSISSCRLGLLFVGFTTGLALVGSCVVRSHRLGLQKEASNFAKINKVNSSTQADQSYSEGSTLVELFNFLRSEDADISQDALLELERLSSPRDLAEWIENDPKKFFELISKEESFKARFKVTNLALGHLLSVNIDLGMDCLAKIPSTFVSQETLELAGIKLGTATEDQSPQISKLTWSMQNALLRAAANTEVQELQKIGMSGQFPSAAAQYLNSVELQQLYYKLILEARGGPIDKDSLRSWVVGLEKLGSSEANRIALSALHMYAREQPRGALELLDDDIGISEDHESRQALLRGLAYQDPKAAIERALQYSEGKKLALMVMKDWLEQDSIEASRWLAKNYNQNSDAELIKLVADWADSHGNSEEAHAWRALVKKGSPD